MNSKVPNILDDKENHNFKGKSQEVSQLRRSFGTELLRIPFRVHDVDRLDEADPQRLGEYAKEIFTYLYSVEHRFLPQFGYMRSQTDVNEKMRAMLFDWLVEVHHKFKLLPETMFLTVNLVDRYLEKEAVQRTKLQLVGVTAMLIATKYEEIYPPEVKDFVYITDKAYTREEIIEMESTILRTLEFNITTVSPLRFLERFSRISDMPEKSFNMAKYLVELPIIEYRMLRYKPSLIAASAVYLTNKILNLEPT